MIRTFTIVSLALLFTAAAHADPVRLGDTQMDGVTAGQSAKNPYYAITGDSVSVQSGSPDRSHPVFQPTGWGSVGHVNVPSLRFGSGGAFVVPGQGGAHANVENSAFANSSKNMIRPPGHK